MAAYAITRLDFPGKTLILAGALAISMFPAISIVGGLFNVWRAIGLYDTWLGLILPYLSFSLPLSIYILSAFFREIPWDLEKAAQMDGATPLQAFRRVILPLAMPGVFTAGILTFISAWNDFLFANVLTSTDAVTHGAGRAGVLPRRIAVHGPERRDRGRSRGRDDPDPDHGADLPATHRLRPHRRRGQGLRSAWRTSFWTGSYKRYSDGFKAVKDLNLEIADGEFMILVGPSGCGKSTALNMIAGLEDISAGELRIGGEVVNKKAPRDRDIAMVFQSYALYPHMTVRDNMAFALKLAKAPKEEIDRKVNEAAEILDLKDHLERKPANLSGGQRQRVAMGRAIVRTPKAFLMDEPLSNLDAKLRVQMRAEVARIQHRLNTTTVYVTHDQTEAMTLGDRVAVMLSGVLQQVALADGALQQPGQPVRRRLHRITGHELPARDDRGRRGQAADGGRPAAAGGARADRPRRRRQEADRRHPAGGLRGRGAGAGRDTRPRRRRSRRSSTSSRRWARSSTSTSASRPTTCRAARRWTT